MLWATLDDCIARAAPGVWIPQTPDGVPLVDTSMSSGLLKSEIFPGLWFRTEWLLDEPAPRIDTVLREWGLRGAAA